MKNYEELNQSERRNYSVLLTTREWEEVRARLFKKEEHTCHLCKQKANWDIHVGHPIGYLVHDIVEDEDDFGLPRLSLRWIKQANPLVLHLHHTYYVRNTLPWNYPDSCFQVLCKSCHEKTHREKTILMYATHKLGESQHLTACIRCNGTGYLAECNYYLDGVCFGCNGAGFEELKNTSTDFTGPFSSGSSDTSSIIEDDLPF